MTVIINGSSGITNVNGSAAAPAATGTDTDSGIVYGTNTVSLATNGTTALTVDASQNVGIGTASPGSILDTRTTADALLNVQSTGTIQSAILNLVGRQASVDNIWSVVSTGNGLAGPQLRFTRGGWTGTPSMLIDSSSNLQFNSGYGSVATAYGCRAWVNFNGTGTVAIRASGNVSSITDNGTGDYTVNFTTAMPDANFATTVQALGGGWKRVEAVLSASVEVTTYNTSNALADPSGVYVAVFR